MFNQTVPHPQFSPHPSFYTGNPYLLPSISNNFNISYTYKKYIASISYSREKNVIARYQLRESADKDMLIISPQNIAWQNEIFLQIIPLD